MKQRKYKPTVRDYQIEFPDNSYAARTLKSRHPRIMAFEEKYKNTNWRARLR
jgi:hypothetical protein